MQVRKVRRSFKSTKELETYEIITWIIATKVGALLAYKESIHDLEFQKIGLCDKIKRLRFRFIRVPEYSKRFDVYSISNLVLIFKRLFS